MPYPKISIEFCTACKWNLRAAWYLQELISTFGTALGEVSLIPSTGGVFVIQVELERAEPKVIWDRKIQGGFPDSKELKRLVRDIIAPERTLGHVDHIKEVEGLLAKAGNGDHKDDETQELEKSNDAECDDGKCLDV